MTKTADTSATLAEYMQSCARRRFAWGVWDCCLFAADVMRFSLGRDPAARWRGTYANEEESVRLIKALGGCARALTDAGMAAISPPYRNGDVGVALLCRGAHIEGLVVYWQGNFLAPTADRGLAAIAARHVLQAYRAT